MSENSASLTIFFQDPFWVGVFSRRGDGGLSAAKVTFGAEPTDQEVYAFLLSRYAALRFSPPVADAGRDRPRNPKRARREAKKQLRSSGAGTKARQALQLQREQGKAVRERESRAEKEAEARRRYAQKRQKRKEKHKGH